MLWMPCNLHFMAPECEDGFHCPQALNDPDGVHVVHGSSNRFMTGRVFYPVFKYYKKVIDLVCELSVSIQTICAFS